MGVSSLKKVRIVSGPVEAEGELNETATALRIWESLPISAVCNTWGDEIYFAIPLETELEDGREVVDMGDIGYWPPGNALCIFFGPTPASRGDEIRPASPVTIVGKVTSEPRVLAQIAAGGEVTVSRKE